MARRKLNELSKEQLISLKNQLTAEIENLSKVIEASNTTVFDLLIGKVKKEMQANIIEEEWKKLKENQKKIESYRSIEATLQNQEDLLERKEQELEDVEESLKYYQTSLFEEQENTEERISTEILDSEGNEYKTGDVYEKNEPNGKTYFLIKKSTDLQGSFAIISNSFEGERLMQYAKNLQVLENAFYIGNIYDEYDNQEAALEGLKAIADSQEQTTTETEAEPSPDKCDVVDEYYDNEEDEVG